MKVIRKLNVFLLIVSLICTIVFTIKANNEEKYGNYENKIAVTFSDVEDGNFNQKNVYFTVKNNGTADLSSMKFEVRITNASNSNESYTSEIGCSFYTLKSGDSKNYQYYIQATNSESWLKNKTKNELKFAYRIKSVTFTNNKTYNCEKSDFKGDLPSNNNQNQHTHNYVPSVINPTCIEQGYTINECDCGDSYVSNYVNALGHNFDNYVSDGNATCTSNGTKTAKCTRCDVTDTKTDVGSKLNHSFTNYVSNNNATCTEYGTKTAKCDRCDVTNTITDATFNHNYANYYCTICNAEYYTKGLDFVLNDNKYIVADYKGNDSSVYIPSVYNGLPVISIGIRAFYNCYNLTSIVIPNSVTSIGDYAFSGCNIEKATIPAFAASHIKNSSLKEVVITSGASIGEGAFRNCTNLTSVAIPNSVTSIGDYAFEDCDSLTSVVIPNSVTSIGYSAFEYCDGLEEITLPFVGSTLNGTTNTHFGYIFGAGIYLANIIYVPSSLKKVTITGDSNIGEHAFFECSNLTTITIPNSVTSIGDYAFYYCKNLTSVVIPDSVTSIGNYAFRNCTNLTSVVIPNSVTSIGDNAFAFCANLTSIVIPNSVTSIGNYAFEGCSNLTSVVIGSGVTRIGEYAFSMCFNLTSVVIPNSVTSIGDNAFSSCTNLTSVVIPNSVTSIPSGAFYNCTSLPSVVIPNSVTSIGDYAFAECTNLTSVVIPNSVTSIGEYAFCNCTNLTSITVDDNNTYYKDVDGVLYTKDGKTLICYPAGKTATTFIIPNTVEGIGYRAFERCKNLTSVVMGNSVTSIGEYAFCNCTNLTSVVIGDSVTSIVSGAFYNCDNLTSIKFNDTSTWYRTTNSDYTGGTQIDVTNPSTNATNFKSTYYNYYWYKI